MFGTTSWPLLLIMNMMLVVVYFLPIVSTTKKYFSNGIRYQVSHFHWINGANTPSILKGKDCRKTQSVDESVPCFYLLIPSN